MAKAFLTFFIFPFLFAGSFEGCEKESLTSNVEFEVKVVAIFCAYTILEIQDPVYHELGMDWRQYTNVFTVANPCDLPEGMQIGISYKCRIIEKAITEDCIQCAGYMETPPLIRLVRLAR